MNFMPTRAPVTPALRRVDRAVAARRADCRRRACQHRDRAQPGPARDSGLAHGQSSDSDLFALRRAQLPLARRRPCRRPRRRSSTSPKQHGLHGWVLIATGDQDMRMIAQNHALLSQYFRVATPDWDTIQWAYDKRLTYQRAAALGIDFPASFRAARPGRDRAARLPLSGHSQAGLPQGRRRVHARQGLEGGRPRAVAGALQARRRTGRQRRHHRAGMDPRHRRSAIFLRRPVASAASRSSRWSRGAAGSIRSISAARAPTSKPSSKAKSKSWPAAS